MYIVIVQNTFLLCTSYTNDKKQIKRRAHWAVKICFRAVHIKQQNYPHGKVDISTQIST